MNPIAPCTWWARAKMPGSTLARVRVGERDRARRAGGIGRCSGVEPPRGLVREHAHGVDLHPHVDALVRDGLVHADGTTELLAVRGVVDGEVECTAREPDRVRGVDHGLVRQRALEQWPRRRRTTSSEPTATSVKVTAA